MQPGDIAGLGMLGDPRGYIAVTKDSKRIIMSEEEGVKATVNNITSNILYFRIEMNFGNKQAKFFWKDDTRNWQQLGTTITMGFDWQYGTFQGEQYAILNFNPSGSSGYVDVDWFRLNDEPGPGGNQTPTPANTNVIDINNDGAINMADVILLASVFNSVRGDSKYIEAYDINKDGAINMSDVILIAAKFNTII
jgi:hypothetical protein